jgi:class 3 adenylate cyclase/tetratricopeptide (TPR) repeat protein
MQCPRCQQENPPQAKFCLECATPLALRCAGCGTQLPAGAKFCFECAAPVRAPGSPPRFASPETYTPKHLAEKILTSKAALEGERKQVTVLFADLKGSMELLADRDPEEARKLLDPVLERMMEAVHRYEGTVNQVMGDGIMALFGAPLAHEDHAVRACYAALRMQELVKQYAEEVFRSYGVPIQIRVGLNSGEVVVRAIGSDLHMDYTAVGQTTHLAARMEQMATPGQVLLAPATLQLAEGYVQVAARGPVAVKGLPDLVDVYALTGASALRTRLHAAAARGLTRFVGRDAEIEQIRRALALAQDGHGQLVAVVGEPGVGKSRLVYEFTHSHRTQDWLILEASSVSYGKATSYLPVIDLLKAYFKVEDRETHREIREKVTGKLLTLDRILEPTLPALLALLDVPVEDAQWQALDPAQRRQRTLEAVKHLLLRESQGQPVLVVFEDLHWIDAETQALLDGLVESLPTARLVLLVNYRPEYQHGWGRKTYYSQVRLDALPPESAGELLNALLGDDPALEPLKRLLVKRGNPFFIEESIRTLVETGALVGERGAYRLTRPIQAIEVPATVQVILAARIDRLPADDKQLLQTASVIGKDVPFVLLHAVAELTEDAGQRGLAHLQAAEFLYETRLFPDPEYTFKHALTHEVTYGTLLQERRKVLHARIVGAIERSYPDRLNEHVERLAHHAVRAAMGERAVRYLRQAGEKAVARSANREAIALFEQALAALQLSESRETLSEALDIRIALGPCLGSVHGNGAREYEASYVAARELCLRLDDRPRLFPALWGLWHVSFNRGLYREARDRGEELLSLARELGDPVLLLEAHHSLWATLYGSGDLETAELHLQEGLAQYDPQRHRAYASVYGGHDTGVCCLNFAAVNAWTRGYPDRALRFSQEALRLVGQLSDPRSTTIALYYAALVHRQRGEHRAAVAKAEAALDTASTHGLQTDRPALLVRLGLEGALEESELARLHQRARPPWWLWFNSFVFCLIAEAYARAGMPDGGLAALAEIPEQALETVYAPEVHRWRGELLLGQGDAHASEAETCFRRAVEVARRGGHRSLELRAATSLSRLLAQHGHREEARRILGEVYGWFTEGFDTADLKVARELLDSLDRPGAGGRTILGDTTIIPPV